MPETKNSGLAGGTLDATKHIERAIPRLLNKPELDAYFQTLAGTPVPVAAIAGLQPGRMQAEHN
jgi:hypothetical protein